jgi:cyclophilin family peptidyl-prolyl cis-trans isomerase
VGQICIAAEVIVDPIIHSENYDIDAPTLLREAENKLVLPRDSEALQIIQNGLSNLGLNTNSNLRNVFTHPLEWDLIESLSDTTKAVIKTEKGNIVIQFFMEKAPGTIANFIDLAQLNYYSEKYFHRVVPNFVIQGGCSRGDGYGSLDYNIRSELSQTYFDSEGYIGMASAGNHTESAQWFITHSPTPHLDGNYTLFGKVISGMEVVHSIEVGDKIVAIEVN